MTPQEFVNRWANLSLNEQQSGQAHFLDLCRLVGVEMPAADGITADGDIFVFEHPVKKLDGYGRADVYYEGRFAVEYKTVGKYPDLDAAFKQLTAYKDDLKNPPLLVVTDFNRWEIHTNFVNTQNRPYVFKHEDIKGNPEVFGWLRDMFHAPERLHPRRHTERVTQDAAKAFQAIADNLRQWDAGPTQIAYFLTKLVFCMFAEDVRLLPTAADDSPDGIFTHIVKQSRRKPSIFKNYLQNLFATMNDGGDFLMREIRYFNGTLFIYTDVEALSAEALDALAQAVELNWKAIEPSIFGTLFERSLDPGKRAQLGAHYTSRDDILLIVEPVLMQPLRYEWDTVQLEAEPIRKRYDSAKSGRARNAAASDLLDLRERILDRIRRTTVLDPACGSGNFLYVALQMLMDLEKEIIEHSLWSGLQRATPEVHPRQMYGIEKDPIAHALASIVVWIGYIQWRTNNAYTDTIRDPILEQLKGNIVCKDAILPNPPQSPQSFGGKAADASENPGGEPPSPTHWGGAGGGVESVHWPAVDVIVGNPPFLGAKRMRGELGNEYVDRLRNFYQGRLPAFTDLVAYWFEVAREQIARGNAKRVGLLATNSIGMGTNLTVIKRIKNTGDIFMAWSDREWVLEGAAVRVAMIGFDSGDQQAKMLDGLPVKTINPNLTATVDVTSASILPKNEGIAFIGVAQLGPFVVDGETARSMIRKNYNNTEVIRPYMNAKDIVRRISGNFIIDFGNLNESQISNYTEVHEHALTTVRIYRQTTKALPQTYPWWQHWRPRPELQEAKVGLAKCIATPNVSKYRLFVWIDSNVVASHAVTVICRKDDYFFGILHSKQHEVWSLRMGTSLGPTPRYTPSTTFETFPFPWPPSEEDTASPAHARISRAAAQLHEERHAWLNPNDELPSPTQWGGAGGGVELKDRTLTNLYNALQVFRGVAAIKTKPAAADFAPRLDELHRELDEAVCDAYGWGYELLDDEEEILRRLLALNLERA